MKPLRRRPNTVSIIPERKHARPAGTRLITRSTTVRPFVYNLPSSDCSDEPVSTESKKSKVENQENVAGANNANISHMGNSSANKTEISTDSLYCTTPNKSASPRKQRYMSRSLLKEFHSMQEDTGGNTLKTNDFQKKEFQLKTFKNVPSKESLRTGKLRKSPKSNTVLLKSSQEVSNTSQSQLCNQFPQEESIITKRKHSYSIDVAVSHESLHARRSERILSLSQSSNTSPSKYFEHSSLDNLIINNRKRKHSLNIAVSNGMSIVASKTSISSKTQSICSPMTKINSADHVIISQQSHSDDANLTPEQSTTLEQISCFSAIAAEEKYSLTNTNAESSRSSRFAIEGPSKANISTCGNTYETFQESMDYQIAELKKCSVVLDRLPLPCLKDLEKAVEESSTESKQNESSEILKYNARLNERSTIDDENVENKKENNITDDGYLNKVNKNSEQEPLLARSKTSTNSASFSPRVQLENILQLKNQPECLMINDENAVNEEKNITGDNCLVKINNSYEQEPLLSRSKTQTKSATSFPHVPLENISQLKNQSEYSDLHISLQIQSDNIETASHSSIINKDNTQEQLSLVKSVTSVQTPLESISQLKNKNENTEENNNLIKISEISPPSVSDHPETLSNATSTVENISSQKVQYQNLVPNKCDSEPLIFEQTEQSFSQQKDLKHSSNEHLTYKAIVGVRRTVSKQPRKPKRKTKPDDNLNYSADKQPLFEGHRKIRLWKGKTGNRPVSDLTDLDIALNVIERVIEEISEEDQSKQDLLRLIQEKYNSSLYAMIIKTQSTKKKNKEIKELMATVKELASELDQIVDNKIRLQSELLESKAQQKIKTTTNGPTWEDMNYL